MKGFWKCCGSILKTRLITPWILQEGKVAAEHLLASSSHAFKNFDNMRRSLAACRWRQEAVQIANTARS
jgi:hypothetical protein